MDSHACCLRGQGRSLWQERACGYTGEGPEVLKVAVDAYLPTGNISNGTKLAGAGCPAGRNRRMRNRTSVVWEDGRGDPASYPIKKGSPLGTTRANTVVVELSLPV